MWGFALLCGLGTDTTRELVLTLAIPTASIAVVLAVQYQTAEQEMASTPFLQHHPIGSHHGRLHLSNGVNPTGRSEGTTAIQAPETVELKLDAV